MTRATWFLHFLYNQFFITPQVPKIDFTGQTIIVTGSNTGLGLEAARHLSRLNATLVILAVRTVAKGEAAKSNILASTEQSPSSIEVWSLDMTSIESIKSFAERASRLDRLDAVLENAGMMTQRFNIVEGYESTIMTNVIGTFCLALLMIPILRASGAKWRVQPKLSIVASDAYNLARFRELKKENIFEAMNDPNSQVSFER
jgi:retinol dehydrogenase-12